MLSKRRAIAAQSLSTDLLDWVPSAGNSEAPPETPFRMQGVSYLTYGVRYGMTSRVVVLGQGRWQGWAGLGRVG